MTYTPPTRAQLFVLNHVLNLPERIGFAAEDSAAILEASGQLASETLAPLNRSGDREHARLADGKVVTPTGHKEAYRAYVDGGWNGLAAAEEFGGQNLPHVIAMAVQEHWQSANMGFALCGLLTQGAVVLLAAHGSEAQKQKYLPKLVSGDWTGTMNLTEPQAGSDVGAVRTRAIKQSDDSYRIIGQKIFISYGDHDYTDNIIHLVLARIDGAPEGTKGLSLFLVPKLLDDGSLNDLAAVSLEHKLGLHASPTAVMSFGDKGGAYGELVGAENSGIKGMFTMMNEARLGVGVQGFAIAERAYQQALAYAQDRQQGGQPIINYPDVRRMLLTMVTQIDAARMIAYRAALAADLAKQADVDFLTPIVKAYSTDLANEVTSLNIQVHGGMGVIEETGAAQHYRDARVLAIYEGTNGIQGNDFMFRKVLRDEGAVCYSYLNEMNRMMPLLYQTCGERSSLIAEPFSRALDAFGESLVYAMSKKNDKDELAAIASPFLRLVSLALGGIMHAEALIAAHQGLAAGTIDQVLADRVFTHAQFYAHNILPETLGLKVQIASGGVATLAWHPD